MGKCMNVSHVSRAPCVQNAAAATHHNLLTACAKSGSGCVCVCVLGDAERWDEAQNGRDQARFIIDSL